MGTIEAIERATLDAVPPQRLDTWDTWLLGLDHGTVGRCHSAVPLRHTAPRADSLLELERRYQAAGLAPVLRIPDVAPFAQLRRELAEHGYREAKATLVQTASLDLRVRQDAAVRVNVTTVPGGDWEQVFLGEGFDPVDGASRLEILRRGKQSLFASVRQDGGIAAVGAAGLSHGWCGLHGMRTLPAWRGRGLASAILAALAAAARARGLQQAFLQVDAANAVARSLYARAGFSSAWSYAYWSA